MTDHAALIARLDDSWMKLSAAAECDCDPVKDIDPQEGTNCDPAEHNVYCNYRINLEAVSGIRDAIAALTADRAAESPATLAGPLIEPDNHHNALVCPYCNPERLKFCPDPKAHERAAEAAPPEGLEGIAKETVQTITDRLAADDWADFDSVNGERIANEVILAALRRASAADPSIAERELVAQESEPTHGAEVLCEVCAAVFCPHADRLHFHHDGCPSCVAAAERMEGR